MALGKKPLVVLGVVLTVSPDLDRVIMDYAHSLVRKAYFTTRIKHPVE